MKDLWRKDKEKKKKEKNQLLRLYFVPFMYVPKTDFSFPPPFIIKTFESNSRNRELVYLIKIKTIWNLYCILDINTTEQYLQEKFLHFFVHNRIPYATRLLGLDHLKL